MSREYTMTITETLCKTVTVEAGGSITFDPDTAHAPLIGEGTIHKAIFKVEVA